MINNLSKNLKGNWQGILVMDNIRLLIVEDDPVWMKCISDYLEKENDITVVKKAFTEAEALQVNCSDIDVALMDLNLSDDEDFSGMKVA